MAYSDFSMPEVVRRFELTLDENVELFSATAPVAPSPRLREDLDEGVPLALALSTEKARSELIVVPILLEVRRRAQSPIGLFSGVDFSVDPSRGLNGVCDYLISRVPEQLYVRSPELAIVEAKNDNIKSGLGQCVAEMVAAQLFNQREENAPTALFGAVTTGSNWRFLRLTGSRITMEPLEHYLDGLDKILGILLEICK